MRYRALQLLLAFFVFAFLQNNDQALGAEISDQESAQLAMLLADHSWQPDSTPIDWARVAHFYARNHGAAVWHLRQNVDAALGALENADSEGLLPADYHVPTLEKSPHLTGADDARFDLLLSDAVLAYAHDLHRGRVPPKAVEADVQLPSTAFDVVGTMLSSRARGELAATLAALAPSSPQYAALRASLARLRAVAANGGWPLLPDQGEIRLDGSDRRAAVLVDRLVAEGVLSEETDDAAEIRDAVSRFQEQHGLQADGRVGAKTLTELNVPVADRAAQIEANMERWRWLPHDLEQRRIEINVPDASLDVWDGDKLVLSSRIIVGRKTDPTPILSTKVQAVVINPAWEIPVPIARKEILPAIQDDPNYLADHHIVLVNPPLGFRQLPGPDNALGALKLDMPNRFDVYLHDTPAKGLFEQADRDLSHGCMRVEQILPLASFALAGDPNSALEDLQVAIQSGLTSRVPLVTPLPVYALYWTAWVDSNGTLQFRHDLYGRDERLIAALHGQLVGTRRDGSDQV